MTSLQRTYTFADGVEPKWSQVESEIQNIVTNWNNHDQGISQFTNVLVSTSSVFYSPIQIGNTQIGNFVSTPTTGGTVPSDTYYYKVYPVFGSFVGAPSDENVVVIGGSNNAANLSWDAVTNATEYRVQRGVSQGGPDGWWEVGTATSYIDNGAAFDHVASNPWTEATTRWLNLAGSIIAPASSGGFFFRDYVDNSIQGGFSVTSAGEIQYTSPANGASAGVHRFFGAANQGLLTISSIGSGGTAHTELGFVNSGGLSDVDLTYGSNCYFRAGNTNHFVVTATNINPLVDGNYDLGTSSLHYRTIYLSTSLINTATSNQIVLGTTRTATITAPTPASASRTYTFPDLSGDYSVVGTLGTQTISGTKTFDGQLIGKGTATNDSASSGYIGETVTGTQTSSTSFPTTTEYGDLTSISLTAGDWLVDAFVTYAGTAVTFTTVNIGISTTSGNSSTGLQAGDNLGIATVGGSGLASLPNGPIAVPGYRMSLSGTTTVYLKYRAVYPGTAPTAQGRLTAVRIR